MGGGQKWEKLKLFSAEGSVEIVAFTPSALAALLLCSMQLAQGFPGDDGKWARDWQEG
mgnify:CR=1 FL=1